MEMQCAGDGMPFLVLILREGKGLGVQATVISGRRPQFMASAKSGVRLNAGKMHLTCILRELSGDDLQQEWSCRINIQEMLVSGLEIEKKVCQNMALSCVSATRKEANFKHK